MSAGVEGYSKYKKIKLVHLILGGAIPIVGCAQDTEERIEAACYEIVQELVESPTTFEFNRASTLSGEVPVQEMESMQLAILDDQSSEEAWAVELELVEIFKEKYRQGLSWKRYITSLDFTEYGKRKVAYCEAIEEFSKLRWNVISVDDKGQRYNDLDTSLKLKLEKTNIIGHIK